MGIVSTSPLVRKIPQMILGSALIFTGLAHLTSSRLAFRAQVPSLFKDYADLVVVTSGVAEILLGVGLIALWKYRLQIGWLVGLFFVVVFWGNISQYVNHVNAFGLNSDEARLIRLLFQPLLVAWALISTGAWKTLRIIKSK